MKWIKIDGNEIKPIDKEIILRLRDDDNERGTYHNGWYNENIKFYYINDEPFIDQDRFTHYIILEEPNVL